MDHCLPLCKMREIPRTVSRILHVFDPALPHFTQTRVQTLTLLLLLLLLTAALKSNNFRSTFTMRFKFLIFMIFYSMVNTGTKQCKIAVRCRPSLRYHWLVKHRNRRIVVARPPGERIRSNRKIGSRITLRIDAS